ncbi:MAG TPA: putative porin [Chthoniobacter sp.]|nr:putative porin [Chthoniobacter sp.]
MTRSILCGTIAIVLASATAFAADSDEARLKKLEAAVNQLQQENASLKNELHTQESTDFASSSAAKIKMSDSITEVKLYGEGRLRYFMNEGVAAGKDAGDTGQRERLRYRLRLGADVKLQENWMLGVLLETNSSARSANVTLGENPVFAKATVSTTSVLTGITSSNASSLTGATLKGGKLTTTSGKTLTAVSATKGNVVSNVNIGDTLFVGRAYLRNQPTDWLTISGGKIPNPFVSTRMTWDPDINPEGFSEQIKVTLGGGSHGPSGKDSKEVVAPQPGMTVDLFANFGQFIYNDVAFENTFNTGSTSPFDTVPNGHDRWMFEYQIGTKVNFNKDTYFQIAPSFYHYTGGGSTSAGPFNGDNALVILDDKARAELVTFNQTGVNDLAVIDIPVEFTWKMFNTRFSIFGDYAQNLDAASRASNAGHENTRQGQAWQLGASIGQTKKKGDWELRGWYQHSEQFALDPNIIDDDIFDGRLNMQGYFLQGTYMLTDAVSIILQYSHGSRIDTNLGTAGSGALGTPAGFPLQSTNLVYIDLNLKF